jgi:hypothetical protein
MVIIVNGDGWRAEVLHSDGPQAAVYNVYCDVRGISNDTALAGAEWVLDHFAGGRVAHIRDMPEATSEKCFDTKETKHAGFVRFSYRPEAGSWSHGAPSEIVNFRVA